MSIKEIVRGLGVSLASLGALCTSAMTLVGLPVSVASAQSLPSCVAGWDSNTIYNGGNSASRNGVNYNANWWTRGDDPLTNSGPTGSGKPWTTASACSGGTTTPPGGGTTTPPGGGSGSSGNCPAAWTASATYLEGNSASKNGISYKANWWTRGDDPVTNSGPSGSGLPWTTLGSCSGSGTTTPPGGGGTTTPPGGGTGTPPGTVSGLLFSPYKDAAINMNWNTFAMQTAVMGSAIPVVGSGSLVSNYVPNLGAITLAFATGECGNENWGGVAGTAFANANISALNAANVNYVVSTGGAAGAFTCSTQQGMRTFLSRYTSSHMVGLDFDIEGGQSQADIANLIAQSVYAQTLYPNLRVSFTLATLAASDASRGSLNPTGDAVVKAIKASALKNYTINLMVMDYGAASPTVCVVVNGVCNMGQSAIQAAKNVQYTYGLTNAQIELTPMIGLNDVISETFTLSDVDAMVSYAVSQGLAGVHFWSLDRDTPCASSANYASATCNSVAGSTALQYTKRFLTDLGK